MAGIYLHIPFCKRRCIYCDFFSTTCSDKQNKYIKALCQELELRKDYLKGAVITTIYLGGGTPSQLSQKELEEIFTHIYKIYNVSPNAEITFEANPDDLTASYITMLHTLPINRISMGIQTFHEETLQLLHRRHTATQAIHAYQECRNAGFNNISIDLMYGLPGTTLSNWKEDLQQALALRPEHISAYHLIYEKETPLWNLLQQKQVKEADEDVSLSLFQTLIETLTQAGYIHYEISNFCLSGFQSRHNSSYWTGELYLGCGASAHSYNGISRQWNISSLDQYIEGMERKVAVWEIEDLDIGTRYNDFIITRLRTRWGLSLHQLRNEFGEKLYAYCLQMADLHLKQQTLEIVNNTLKLTSQGIFISDSIMSDLLWVE